MTINESLTIIGVTLMILGFLSWSIVYITSKYLIPKNENESKKLTLEKYNLFSILSIEDIEKLITDYVTRYLEKYITYKFITKKINYIREPDVQLMIKDVTKLIYLEISEVYVFYMKMIYPIKEDEDLLKFINIKVKDVAIDTVTNYNSSMEE